MEYRFLFIHSAENQSFGQTLKHVLAPYGTLEIVSWDELISSQTDLYTLIFLDAGVLADTTQADDNLPQFVSHVCQRFATAKVIVVTTSPTWRRARESLQAGAVDYIRQTLDEDRLRADLGHSLQYVSDL